MFRPTQTSAAAPTGRKRIATTILEVIVSLSLLMSALSLSLPLVLKHGHLLIEQRNYRLALEELTNALDRLAATSPSDLPRSLQQLAVSAFTSERLRDAKLTADLKAADIGQRLTLTLTWKDSSEQKVVLAGWILPSPTSSATR